MPTFVSTGTGDGNLTLNITSVKDPLLVNASAGNFTLSSSSPAIDAGANLGSIYQLGLASSSTWPSGVVTLNQNSYGSGWDIGAYVSTQTSTPSVAMTAPANLATVSSTVTLAASSTAVAPASISSVQFYLDGSPLGSPVTASSSPNTYSYFWNTASSSNGSHIRPRTCEFGVHLLFDFSFARSTIQRQKHMLYNQVIKSHE